MKTGHGLKRGQGGVYERVWGKQREGRNVVIKLQSQNKQNNKV